MERATEDSKEAFLWSTKHKILLPHTHFKRQMNTQTQAQRGPDDDSPNVLVAPTRNTPSIFFTAKLLQPLENGTECCITGPFDVTASRLARRSTGRSTASTSWLDAVVPSVKVQWNYRGPGATNRAVLSKALQWPLVELPHFREFEIRLGSHESLVLQLQNHGTRAQRQTSQKATGAHTSTQKRRRSRILRRSVEEGTRVACIV